MSQNASKTFLREEVAFSEEQIAKQLQKICDENGKEKQPQESAKLLHKLGLIYWNKGPDKISLIRSAALLNSAILRKPKNVEKIQQDLEQFCSQLLQTANAQNTEVNLITVANRFKNDLTKIRDEVKRELKNLEPVSLEISDEDFVKLKKLKIEKVISLQNEITENYKRLMFQLSEVCVDIMGEPPCKYALVGLGSLARKEITPYSDFENIIILEEGIQDLESCETTKDYFRWFAVIFQVVLINLGETIIPCLDIPCLNGSQSSFKFYDAITPRGVSSDGMVPYACKSPLGRPFETENRPFKLELIQPVSIMASYVNEDADLKNGYHLADMLMTSCFLSGYQDIYNDFQKSVFKQQNVETIITVIRKQIEEKRFDFSIQIETGVYCRNPTANIKRMLYRSSTFFISALGKFNQILDPNCFDILDTLYKQDKLSETDCLNLKFAIAVACESRLKVYSTKGKQDDSVAYSKDVDEILEICDLRSMVEYIAIVSKIQQNIVDIENGFSITYLNIFEAFKCLAAFQPAINWINMHQKTMDDSTFHCLLGVCKLYLNKHEESIKDLEHALQVNSFPEDSKEFLNSTCYYCLSLSKSALNQNEEALFFHNKNLQGRIKHLKKSEDLVMGSTTQKFVPTERMVQNLLLSLDGDLTHKLTFLTFTKYQPISTKSFKNSDFKLNDFKNIPEELHSQFLKAYVSLVRDMAPIFEDTQVFQQNIAKVSKSERDFLELFALDSSHDNSLEQRLDTFFKESQNFCHGLLKGEILLNLFTVALKFNKKLCSLGILEHLISFDDPDEKENVFKVLNELDDEDIAELAEEETSAILEYFSLEEHSEEEESDKEFEP